MKGLAMKALEGWGGDEMSDSGSEEMPMKDKGKDSYKEDLKMEMEALMSALKSGDADGAAEAFMAAVKMC
jgi:hypothetical protein